MYLCKKLNIAEKEREKVMIFGLAKTEKNINVHRKRFNSSFGFDRHFVLNFEIYNLCLDDRDPFDPDDLHDGLDDDGDDGPDCLSFHESLNSPGDCCSYNNLGLRRPLASPDYNNL